MRQSAFGPQGDRGTTGSTGATGATGSTGAQGTTGLASISAQVSVTDSTTETTIITYTIPAGGLSAGTTYRITAYGTCDAPSDASPTATTFRVKIAGTALVSPTVTPPALTVVANAGWNLDALVTCRSNGATGTVVASSEFTDEADLTSLGQTVQVDSPSGTTTVDTTGTLALAVTMQLGETTAGYVARAETAVIELVKS